MQLFRKRLSIGLYSLRKRSRPASNSLSNDEVVGGGQYDNRHDDMPCKEIDPANPTSGKRYHSTPDGYLSSNSSSSTSSITNQRKNAIVMESRKRNENDLPPNFAIIYAISSYLQDLSLLNEDITEKKESPMKLANFILEMMKKIDQRMYDKEIDGPNTSEADVSLAVVLSAAIFLERLPAGTLTKRNLFQAVAVTIGIAMKVIFDTHPTNLRLAKMFGFDSLERFNAIEAKICMLAKFSFSLSDELLKQTKERFLRYNSI